MTIPFGIGSKGKTTLTKILEEQFSLLNTEDTGVKQYQFQVNSFLQNRKIGFSSNSIISIVNIIANTDIIGLLPKATYELYSSVLNLKEIDIDIEMSSLDLFIMYNRASLNNKSFEAFIKKINDTGH